MAKSKFKSKEEFKEVMTTLIDRLKYDQKVGSDIAKSEIIIKFEYTDPDVSVTINAKDKPAEETAYFDYAWDDAATKPEVTLTSSANYSLRFWQGKENVVMSITLGKLKANGNMTKALALLPAIKPAYKIFPEILKEKGRKDLVV